MILPGRGVPVRITQGITPQHSRGGFMRAMAQFGEVVYCRKPPYSGIDGEDYVNIGFSTQTAADLAYEELKTGRVFVDGVLVGVGPSPKDDMRRRSPDRREGGPPVRATFKQRHDDRSPSPRTMARMNMLGKAKKKSRSRSRNRKKSKRKRSSSSSTSRSRSKKRRDRRR
eukprot:TRINITY_DN42194_c0_g2_i1.p1 TRINITY_DN42194_c0_g2~~TRINITY_DN42194_c0_g2_i1.p1  ORF type:complete len:170 (-),score=21.46 TRINITY_DN42194_c0_g2_i1:79-588(-)